jgi:hypothetical protein
MDIQTAVPEIFVDRRKRAERRREQRPVVEDRRATDWRRAADRMERDGRPVTALFFRNEAARVEGESR